MVARVGDDHLGVRVVVEVGDAHVGGVGVAVAKVEALPDARLGHDALGLADAVALHGERLRVARGQVVRLAQVRGR